MTEATHNPAEPVQARSSAKPTSGEFLRKLREEKGLTHAAVGSALHLTVHYIKALESDEYGKLPGLTFVKGYLRAYANFLGADVDDVLARFDEHIAGLLDAGKHTARVERSKRRQDQALRWAIGAGFVVVAGLVAGWWFMSGRDTAPAAVAQTATSAQQTTVASPSSTAVASRSSTPQSGTVNAPAPVAANTYMPALPPTLRTTMPGESVAVASDTAAPPAATIADSEDSAAVTADLTTTAADAVVTNDSPAQPAATEPDLASTDNALNGGASSAATVTPNANGARQVSLIGAGEDELRVTFNGNSWIEVDDGRMVRLYNDQLSAGDTLTIRGEAPFHVLLGDAAQVAVSVNATAIDISPDIRDDSTARLVLSAPVAEEGPL